MTTNTEAPDLDMSYEAWRKEFIVSNVCVAASLSVIVTIGFFMPNIAHYLLLIIGGLSGALGFVMLVSGLSTGGLFHNYRSVFLTTLPYLAYGVIAIFEAETMWLSKLSEFLANV